MKLTQVDINQIQIAPELSRSGSSKQFEDRLRSSIEEIGLAEPIKVAPLEQGGFVVVDGTMRLRAINAIRQQYPDRFAFVPAYVLSYDMRYEIRFQSDIYQDLLPSQLAALVEHLHESEQVRKLDIARFIGVSPATLRNYTGLWRLIQRGGLFAKIVDLMDVNVLPSSTPYAWLRLRSEGVRHVIEAHLSGGAPAESWIDETIVEVRAGGVVQRFPLQFIEDVTGSLPADYYRVDEAARSVKRDLGLRKSGTSASRPGFADAVRHLRTVEQESSDPVLRYTAQALQEYLA